MANKSATRARRVDQELSTLRRKPAKFKKRVAKTIRKAENKVQAKKAAEAGGFNFQKRRSQPKLVSEEGLRRK